MAVRRGITVFVASGDSGSYDCQRADFSDHSLTVDFPADLPQVVGVGGTLLSVSTDGTYFGEAGWEDTLSNAGGGGGVNPHDAAPSWQAAAGAGAGGHRGVPDVAASASAASGWLVRDSGGWSNVGGTSAASPFWAASMLLAEQYARSQGRDAALLPRADPLHARLDAAAVRRPSTTWCSAATATTTRRRAGTTRPASARPTPGTSPATSRRTSAPTRAAPGS